MSRATLDKAAIYQYEQAEAEWQKWFAHQITSFLTTDQEDPSYPLYRMQYLKAFVATILHSIQLLQNTRLPARIRLPALMNANSHASTLAYHLGLYSREIDVDRGNKAHDSIYSLYKKYCHGSVEDKKLDEDEVRRESNKAVEALSKLTISL